MVSSMRVEYLCRKCGHEIPPEKLRTLTRCPACGARFQRKGNKIKGVYKLTIIMMERGGGEG
ncbi:hypothetical protein [Thermococcus sp.]|uniref:hypothetical protein n=1 Tax=Thermococcus sp. TaxID=35749 RepID=UPI0025F9BC26|nr:hypothetical protein [Thermococcus sp.]